MTLHQLTVERNFTYSTMHERDLVSRIAQQCQTLPLGYFSPAAAVILHFKGSVHDNKNYMF